MIITLQIIGILCLAIIAGFLYRMGGSDKFNTKVRDLGIPSLMILSMVILGHLSWSLSLCFLALFGACTTYNKWVGYFFNRPDKHTVYLESWIMTGFLYGLALLPFHLVHPSIGFYERLAYLTICIPLWSETIGDVFWEEFGRGFLIIISLLLFL